MESLREWVLLLSGTALLAAAVATLVPPGAKQAFRVLCAVAALYAVLLPLRGLSFDRLDPQAWLRPAPDAQETMEVRREEAAVLAAQTALQREIGQALQRAGLTALAIEVRCAVFEDGIAPQRILLRGTADKAAVAAVLRPFLTKHTVWKLVTEDPE